MKYLKLFESDEIQELYVETPFEEFRTYIEQNWQKYGQFNRIEEVVSLLNDANIENKINMFGLSEDKRSVGVILNPPDDPAPGWYRYEEDSEFIMKKMEITELEDEWYYVTIGYMDDEGDKKWRVFKCDQWDGLLKFLRDYQIL